MFPAAMSNSTSLSEEASVSSGTRVQDFGGLNPMVSTISPPQTQKIKKKRSLPGNPDPDAEVIALSPKTLLATNRFVCEICNKGFQRDQNLQLHRRGHNLPWKLKQRNSKEIRKRAYVCPEPSCVHHHPSRALGDLTGIKKHYCRKHGEKKWKCEKCSKIYAVQSDWKAHSKTCGTREYRCDCGTLFSRKDSFITHRAFCDALAEESARLSANQLATGSTNPSIIQTFFPFQTQQQFTNPPQTHMSLHPWDPLPPQQNPNPNSINTNSNNNNNPSQNPLLLHQIKPEEQLEPHHFHIPQTYFHNHNHNHHHHHKALINSPFQTLSNPATSAHLSATALLQKAATVGLASTANAAQQGQSVGHMISSAEFGTPSHHHHHHHQIQMDPVVSHMIPSSSNDQYNIADQFTSRNLATWHKTDRLTRDFLGLTDIAGNGNVTTATNTTSTGHGHGHGHGHVNVSINVKNMLSYTDGVGFPHQQQQQHYNERDHTSMLNMKSQGFGLADPSSETWRDC
ncbi:protein indeterminate-domain 12-like [Quercus robur]|uniref:protein indeterminate-domain 12-like n=1 Tax=Quercus robur TaxID=38942 RepID=UPI0021629A2A|nr:protein indeterminate-domain 12-like [Quercus robur]